MGIHGRILYSNTWVVLQVKLYFPGTTTDDPADPYGGILRAIVKDNNDIYIGEDTVTFLDSNGQVRLYSAHS